MLLTFRFQHNGIIIMMKIVTKVIKKIMMMKVTTMTIMKMTMKKIMMMKITQ